MITNEEKHAGQAGGAPRMWRRLRHLLAAAVIAVTLIVISSTPARAHALPLFLYELGLSLLPSYPAYYEPEPYYSPPYLPPAPVYVPPPPPFYGPPAWVGGYSGRHHDAWGYRGGWRRHSGWEHRQDSWGGRSHGGWEHRQNSWVGRSHGGREHRQSGWGGQSHGGRRGWR